MIPIDEQRRKKSVNTLEEIQTYYTDKFDDLQEPTREEQREKSIKAIKERLSTTLENIKYQKNICLWDDIEKIEDCINKLNLI